MMDSGNLALIRQAFSGQSIRGELGNAMHFTKPFDCICGVEHECHFRARC
jgi:hypothetical protein